jgi:RNA polymerase sigma factor (sigma-70 family)
MRSPGSAPHPAELLRRAATHDERAWTALVTRFTPRIRSVARGHRLSAHDVDDVVQTTWLRLFTHIAAVRDPDKLGAYVHTTARRECLRTLGLSRRERPLDLDAPEPATTGEAEAVVAARERAGALATALGGLPPRHAQLMQMLARDPAPSYADVAAALKMPIGSIGPIRARCLRRLAANPELAEVAGPSHPIG